ncbi:D-alanine--D-alanine ligase [Spongiactinospora gelatinilytica]|uniref:D-alanine--D-alanine ligase n=1 Tax=Spongiactinospora gelatinilytica TaxID=2666298 RepID=A0A2W2G2B4_9ACTN|nr:ATP-grasp domain-containing protein [Spongiactinospora gelatinilytica]PZG31048.1 D-alanine--D-alanine ligase [Spongiactinospora gelatinilytica]
MTVISADDTGTIRSEATTLRIWQGEWAHAMRVGLIYGGVSAEDRLYRTKSPAKQLSVTALSAALAEIGVTFDVCDPCDPAFTASLPTYDLAPSNLHGPFGEDGRLQGLLDWLRVPLCGSGVTASAIAADKIACKRMMVALEVPTPRWREWTPGQAVCWKGEAAMVKPSLGGSSLGMALVRDGAALMPALQQARSIDPSPVLVEDHVPGTPVTVGLLELPGGLLAFPPLATQVHDAEWYDAAGKLDPDGRGTVSLAPADLPPPVLDTLTRHSVTLWKGLGCRGAARVDFIVTESGQVYALEVNTMPGMSEGSNFVTGAALCGLTLADVVRALLREAQMRPAYDVPLPVPVFAAPPDGSATCA